MLPELLARTVGAGSELWNAATRRALRSHVIAVRTAWIRAGHTIHVEPVVAVGFGCQPRKHYTSGINGALGLAGDVVRFSGQGRGGADLALPLDQIRWMGVRPVPVGGRRTARGLVIHRQNADRWEVCVFLVPDMAAIAHALAERCGIPLNDRGTPEDFGPDKALRMRQDIYGEWQPDYAAPLYLAPGSLWFDMRHAIPLEAITRIDVYPHRIDQRENYLLRLEYEIPAENTADDAEENEFEVVGFVLPNPEAWSDAIQRRTDALLDIYHRREKRKRKRTIKRDRPF